MCESLEEANRRRYSSPFYIVYVERVLDLIYECFCHLYILNYILIAVIINLGE